MVVPTVDSVPEARRLLRDLSSLWADAGAGERRMLLLTVLDAVYVDARGARAIVSIRPKAAFEAVLAASPTLPVPIHS